MRNYQNLKSLISIIVLGFTLSWITGCRAKTVDETNTITLDIYSNSITELNTSDLIKDIRFIPLETTADNIIGGISKIIKNKDRYYILDASIGKILVFETNGKYLFSFGKIGKGPEEFTKLVAISIDSKNDVIYLLDNGRKIIKTDLNGKFILEKNAPSEYNRIQNIVAHDGFLYGASGQQEGIEKMFQIIQFDELLNPVNYFLPYEYSFPGILSFANRLYEFNNTVNFVNVFENKIYSKSGNSFSERYSLDVGGKSLQLQDMTPDKFVMNTDGIYLFSYCFEGDSLIHLPVFLNGRPRLGLIDKNSNTYYTIDKLNANPYPLPQSSLFYDGWYIAQMNSIQFAQKYPDSEVKPKEEDNPIVIEYQLTFRGK
jgi:hypothetical protein